MAAGPAYALKKTVPLAITDAEAHVRKALADEGFGVLTEIDVTSTLAEKLGETFRPYRILGACNPALAHQALEAETDIGLLLPCNVVVYQGETSGESVVAILDPEMQLSLAGREDMVPLAREVRHRMERVLAAL
jgi:uncharacterized protein (DUF302 family)